MELKEALDVLQDSDQFKQWNSSASGFLSHVFTMVGDQGGGWQFGYYVKDSDMITTFVVDDKGVSTRPEEEVFKKENTQIKPIDLEQVKLDFSQIVKSAKEFQQKNHPNDPPMKIISILQNIKDKGDVWNITFVTQSFNTLNMKLHPATGEVIEQKKSSIFSFKQNA